jgi:hypothetical protein
MSTDVPPSRLRRFFRSWWTRGFLAFIAFAVGSYSYNEWKWERRWQEYVAEKRARGEKVYITEYLPEKPIPDELNFAATPFWNEVFAQNGDGPRVRKFTMIQPLGATRKPKDQTRPLPTYLASYRESFKKAGQLRKDDTELSDAEAILKGLKHLDPEISEIAAAMERPFTSFQTDWEKRYEARNPHLSVLNVFAKTISLRAVACLAAGNEDKAIADIHLGFALADRLRTEPSLLAALVHWSVLSQVLKPISEGLDGKKWSLEDLLKLESWLAKTNGIERTVFAQQSEAAIGNTTMELLSKTGGKAGNLNLFANTNFWMSLYVKRKSFWRENQLWMVRARDEEVSMWDAKAELWTPKTYKHTAQSISGFIKQIDLAVANMASHAEGSGRIALFYYARIRMAGLACALERHRIAKGAYPEKLDALLPDFLQKLPHDACDGQSFRYRLNDEGYLLYSIGTDLVDDGGKVKDLRDVGSGPDWRWWSPLPKAEPTR